MINRSVVIVKAKEPFVNWLRLLPDPVIIDLAELNQDSSAYLLPEYEDDEEREKLMKKYYRWIFEEQLDSWWQNEDDWPKSRDYQTFKQWFQLEFSATIFDLGKDELVDDLDE